jgi:hypothetical protein
MAIILMQWKGGLVAVYVFSSMAAISVLKERLCLYIDNCTAVSAYASSIENPRMAPAESIMSF